MVRHPSVQYVHFYTDGSAARKIEPVIPFKKKTAILPKVRKQKRKLIYMDPVAVLGTCVAVCMLIMMLVGVGQLRSAQAEVKQMQDYVHYLEWENQELTQEYMQSYDLNDIRMTATALGMVPADQIAITPIEISVP